MPLLFYAGVAGSSPAGRAYIFHTSLLRWRAAGSLMLRDSRISIPVHGEPNRLGAYIAPVCAAEGLASLSHTADSAALLPALEEFLDGGAEYA